MSATVDFTTVTNSIAALSITGVTILDSDEIPDTIGLDFGVLAPVPDGFITNVEINRAEISGQKLNLFYTLTYRYYHCQAGKGIGGFYASYAGLITNAAAILKAFAADETLTGAMDNDMPKIANIGTVQDPAGNWYLCADFIIRIMQFLEV